MLLIIFNQSGQAAPGPLGLGWIFIEDERNSLFTECFRITVFMEVA
jgi:hypothetical protein